MERLWRLTEDTGNRRLLGELRECLDEVTLLPRVTVQDARRITLNRLNRQYEPLLNLARLFLEDVVLQLAVGDINAFTFVFDMNLLFERFIINFIRRYRQEILPAEWSQHILRPQSSNVTFYLASRDNRRVFQLKPDLVFESLDQQNQFPLILDTKYKRLDETHARLAVSEDDFYQMFAYAHRYHCPQVLLIYPWTAEMTKPVDAIFSVTDTDKVIRAATVDLHLDLSRASERNKLKLELKNLLQRAKSND